MDAEIESKSEKYNERKVVYNSIGDIIKTKLDPLAERKKELDSFVDVPEGDFVIWVGFLLVVWLLLISKQS